MKLTEHPEKNRLSGNCWAFVTLATKPDRGDVVATVAFVGSEPAGVGWWRRFIATVCDGLVILFGLVAIALIPASIYGDPGGWGEAAGPFFFVVAPLYFALLQAKGQTVGQRFTRTTVRRADSLEPLGYGRAFERAFFTLLFVVTGIVWIVDVLWPLWDKRNQALHDKLVGTIVVDVDALGYHLASRSGDAGCARLK